MIKLSQSCNYGSINDVKRNLEHLGDGEDLIPCLCIAIQQKRHDVVKLLLDDKRVEFNDQAVMDSLVYSQNLKMVKLFLDHPRVEFITLRMLSPNRIHDYFLNESYRVNESTVCFIFEHPKFLPWVYQGIWAHYQSLLHYCFCRGSTAAMDSLLRNENLPSFPIKFVAMLTSESLCRGSEIYDMNMHHHHSKKIKKLLKHEKLHVGEWDDYLRYLFWDLDMRATYTMKRLLEIFDHLKDLIFVFDHLYRKNALFGPSKPVPRDNVQQFRKHLYFSQIRPIVILMFFLDEQGVYSQDLVIHVWSYISDISPVFIKRALELTMDVLMKRPDFKKPPVTSFGAKYALNKDLYNVLN